MNKSLQSYFDKTPWGNQKRTGGIFLRVYIDLRGTMANGERLVSHAYSNAAVSRHEIDSMPPDQLDELKCFKEEEAIKALSGMIWPFLKDGCLHHKKNMPYKDPDNPDEGVTQEQVDKMNSKYEPLAIETGEFYYKIPVTDISVFQDGKWENIEAIMANIQQEGGE